MYANIYRTASAIKYTLSQITVNSWKAECKNNNTVFKKAGRANFLCENLIGKVKDITIRTRASGGFMNRKQIFSITRGVVGANYENALEQWNFTFDESMG